MSVINIAIVCDGTSDICIVDLIEKITDDHFSEQFFRTFAAREVIPAHSALHVRLSRTFSAYEPDIIVCHRDVEAQSSIDRLNEIQRATEIANLTIPVVPATPVRMIESWLLTSIEAIRSAADNRNGNSELHLPRLRAIESLRNPKEVLFTALRAASNLPAQRLRNFNEHRARSRIASFIDNLERLRALPSFSEFEASLITAVSRLT